MYIVLPFTWRTPCICQCQTDTPNKWTLSNCPTLLQLKTPAKVSIRYMLAQRMSIPLNSLDPHCSRSPNFLPNCETDDFSSIFQTKSTELSVIWFRKRWGIDRWCSSDLTKANDFNLFCHWLSRLQIMLPYWSIRWSCGHVVLVAKNWFRTEEKSRSGANGEGTKTRASFWGLNILQGLQSNVY